MVLKKLIKTKSFWSGLSLTIYGLITQDWQAVLSGLSFIFLRDAINKQPEKSDQPDQNV
jgi:hypothetical protein